MKKTILTFLSLIALTMCVYGQKPYDLTFQAKNYVSQTLTHEGKTVTVRAYENIVYVANPVDTAYQKLNIYIPEAYFEGKSINGYTAKTAPIFFPNKIGGYMPAQPATTKDKPMGFGPPAGTPPAPPKPLTIVVALSKGYVVASAGARGRTLKDKNGVFTGKAPAGLIDLKAAIRYLKFNDTRMEGDAKKIISNGTSAGGAMSSLLGATGNNPDYEPYLKALGAAHGTDDIFAVSAYCPITNLDNADMAYEWQFNGINAYKKRAMPPTPPTLAELNEAEIKVSKQLKDLFPVYLNSLKLKDAKGNLLTLDNEGNGNFKDLVKSHLIASAQKAMDGGVNLSAFPFFTLSKDKVTQIDFDAYIKYMERMKTPPAFDGLDNASFENSLFGNASTDKQHFTEFSTKNSTSEGKMVDTLVIKMMNPMYYIGQANITTSKNWRIRHGAKDKDTGFAIPVILATYLQNKGYKVNFALPWEVPHSGDYDLNELFEWVDGICK